MLETRLSGPDYCDAEGFRNQLLIEGVRFSGGRTAEGFISVSFKVFKV